MTGTTTPSAEATAPPEAPEPQDSPAVSTGDAPQGSKGPDETVDPGAVLPDDPEAQNDLA